MNESLVIRLRIKSEFAKTSKFAELLADLAGEAADEIERLNKELEIYKDLYAQELERNGLPR